MNETVILNAREVPGHIPEELVVDWNLVLEGSDRDPYGSLSIMRAGPDIVYSPSGRRGRGTWILMRYDHVSEVLLDAETFSSDRYSGFSAVLGEDWPMIPLEVDPPLHKPFRLMMNKVFAASRIAQLSEKIEVMVREMTEAVRPLGRCDFQEALGRRLPTTVILELVGLPVEDADTFLEWEDIQMHSDSLEARAAAARKIADYLIAVLADREKSPRDDLLTYIAQAEVEGRLLNNNEKLGIAYLLYSAGLDTVASSMGFLFRFLAEHPDIQEDLRQRPEMRQRAVEELLRLHSVTVPGRIVTRDVEFHGVQLRKGDYLSLATMLADRDAAMFADPEAFDISRPNINRHLAFGTGPHNCMGSHLARRELKVAVDYWLDNISPFRIDDPAGVRTHGGSVFGVDVLPLRWDPPQTETCPILKSREHSVAKWKCGHCGFIYDEALGYEDFLVEPGTSWKDVPEDWICPDCGAIKSEFEPYED